jgi:uncharacterized membrane protein YccC
LDSEPIKQDEHSEVKKPSSLKILLLTLAPVLVGLLLLLVVPKGPDEIGYFYFPASGVCLFAAGYQIAKPHKLSRLARVLFVVVVGAVLFVINAAIIIFAGIIFFG